MKRKFKKPLLNVSAKGRGGFMVAHAGYLYPQAGIGEMIRQEDSGFVSLIPGGETEIIKALPRLENNAELPDNAKLKKLEVELEVREDQLEHKANIREEGEERSRSFTVSMEGPTLPSNVAMKLVEGDVFWFSAGELAERTHFVRNFAEHVNTYLDKFQDENVEVYLRFLIKSDTPGKVKLSINAIGDDDYSLIQPQEWSNPLDDTTRIDRNYQLDYGMIESVELNAGSGPASSPSFPTGIDMDIGGEFGLERVLGSIEEHDGREFASISSDYSFAQRIELEKTEFELEKPLKCMGISGFFRTSEEAELYIEIRNDMNGFPAEESPLAKANFSLAQPEKNRNGSWIFIALETPVDLNPDTSYWIVAKGVQGTVRLGLQNQGDVYLKEVFINRGGQIWKPISDATDLSSSALLRVVYIPEYDNQTSAVEIGIKGTELNERLDPGTEAQSITFNLQGINVTNPIITIKSHALGRLSIVNVIQEYSSA